MQIALHTASQPASHQIVSMTARPAFSAVFAKRAQRVVAGMVTVVALASVSADAAEVAPPPAPLAVDAAFATVASFEAGKFVVRFDVLPGHYLYRDRFEMQVNGQAVAKIDSPPGKIKLDPTFGRVEVYEQPLSVTAATKLKEAAELKLVFQGCSAVAGVCYPPTTRSFSLLPGAVGVRPKEVTAVSLKSQFKPQVSQ